MLDVLFAGIFLALGLALVGAGFAVGSAALTTSGFMAARVLFVLGVAVASFSVGCWVWAYRFSDVQKAVGLFLIGGVSLSSLYLLIVWTNTQEIARLPRLFPGNSPDPPIVAMCGPVADGALKIILGSVVAVASHLPNTLFRVRDDHMITVDRDDNGDLVITTLRLFDEKGEILLRFDKGEYWHSEGVRTSRPDKSTLVVYGKSDKQILYVELLNSNTVKIIGEFLHPPSKPIVVTENSIKLGKTTMDALCIENFRHIITIGPYLEDVVKLQAYDDKKQ